MHQTDYHAPAMEALRKKQPIWEKCYKDMLMGDNDLDIAIRYRLPISEVTEVRKYAIPTRYYGK